MSAGNSGAVASAVVIGGGAAGLTAAAGLAARGVEVTVLEARDRVGGRTHGIEVAPGEWVDAGAAYLGDRHTELLSLLKELDLATTPTTMAGASRFALARTAAGTAAGTGTAADTDLDAATDSGTAADAAMAAGTGTAADAGPAGLGDGSVTRDGRFPPLNAVALGDLFDRLAELTAAVRPDAPWLTPEAARLDTLTAAEWAERELTHPDARLFFPLFLGEMMAADPADVSVLHMAFYLRSGGGLRYLNAFEGGAQQDRVAGGAHLLCERLAARLTASPHGRLRLGEPALAVQQDADGVTVRTARGEYRGDVAVVALPSLLADALDQHPALPAPRAGERTGRGCAVKLHLVYPAPLWREHGLSGWSVNAEGPLLSTVDDSPSGTGAGVLTGFVTGAEAHRFAALDPAQQRAAAVAQAARLFPMLPEPIGLHVTDWVNEPYSKGCYAALFGPGDWLRLGPALTAPHGRVHWAGTETSTEFFGLLEGAVRSGRRVVAEILDRPAG